MVGLGDCAWPLYSVGHLFFYIRQDWVYGDDCNVVDSQHNQHDSMAQRKTSCVNHAAMQESTDYLHASTFVDP